MSEITADEVPGTPIERPSFYTRLPSGVARPDPGPAPDRGAGRDHPHRWRPGRSHPAADRDPQRAAGDPAGAGHDHGRSRQRRARRGDDRPGPDRRRLLELHVGPSGPAQAAGIGHAVDPVPVGAGRGARDRPGQLDRRALRGRDPGRVRVARGGSRAASSGSGWSGSTSAWSRSRSACSGIRCCGGSGGGGWPSCWP